MNPTGADVAKAVRLLNQTGITVASLAADLGVSARSVYRWRRGGNPSHRNYQTLRYMVTTLTARTLAGNTIADARQGELLQAANEALLTAAEVARLDQLAARLRDTAYARRLSVPQPRRSAYADVDPFVLAGGGQPAPAPPF